MVVTKNNLYTINTFYTTYTVLNVSKKLFPVLFESWHFPIRILHVVVLIFTCSWFWPVQIELRLFSKELNAGAKIVKFNISIKLKHPLSCIFLALNASVSTLRHTAELFVGLCCQSYPGTDSGVFIYIVIHFCGSEMNSQGKEIMDFLCFSCHQNSYVVKSHLRCKKKKRQVNGLECSLNFSDLQHRFFCMYVIQPLDVSAVGQYSKGSKPHYSGLDFIYWHLEQCGFLWLGCSILVHCASNLGERMKSTREKRSHDCRWLSWESWIKPSTKLRRAWRRDMKDSGNEVRLQQTSGPMQKSQEKVGKPSREPQDRWVEIREILTGDCSGLFISVFQYVCVIRTHHLLLWWQCDSTVHYTGMWSLTGRCCSQVC